MVRGQHGNTPSFSQSVQTAVWGLLTVFFFHYCFPFGFDRGVAFFCLGGVGSSRLKQHGREHRTQCGKSHHRFGLVLEGRATGIGQGFGLWALLPGSARSLRKEFASSVLVGSAILNIGIGSGEKSLGWTQRVLCFPCSVSPQLIRNSLCRSASSH